MTLSDLLSERIWMPMGAEEDAHLTHNAHGAYMARGVHGQGIYIDPKAEMVIARYASHPAAGNAANDPVTLPAYMALAKDLMAGG
jgi:CubicO group peptidase (beta-lactamase class C family)